ncbi:LORF2 protein, partial [Crocuta crocuta]
DFIKIKSFWTVKDTINKTKRQPAEWVKIFADDISDKWLVSRTYKELTYHNLHGPHMKGLGTLNRIPSGQGRELLKVPEAKRWKTLASGVLSVKPNRIHILELHSLNKSENSRCWQGCGETGTLLHCWWECKLVQPLWKTVWRFLRKLTIELPYDPGIALLGIYPRDTEMLMHRSTCTPMFIAALSTIAKTWKEPKCPSMDEWIKKMWFIYMMEYYMAMRNNEIWPCVATWMDLEGVMLSEINQAEKDKYHMFARIGGL